MVWTARVPDAGTVQASPPELAAEEPVSSVEGMLEAAPTLPATGVPAALLPSTTAQISAPTAQASLPPDQASEPERDSSPAIRLVIPLLKVDAGIQPVPLKDNTWDVSGLGNDIGLLGGTSLPGLGSNTVLAGHIATQKAGNGPFRLLYKLKPGELFIVYTEKYRYTYRVREQDVVRPEEAQVVAATHNPQVTLLTCADWNEDDWSYNRRLVVFADLVQIDPWTPKDSHE